MTDWPRSVLVFCPEAHGGLAEHVHYQACELARRGIAVNMLCPPRFLKPATNQPYLQHRFLQAGPAGRGMAAKALRAGADTANRLRLAVEVARQKPDFVLLSANAEYRAATWVFPHLALHGRGMIYLANFHDHRFMADASLTRRTNIRLAYAMLDGGLDHGGRQDEPYLPKRMVMRQAPFGAFSDLELAGDGSTIRQHFSIPAPAKVALAFGHVRDAKNLHIALRAVAAIERAHLIVAGQAANASQASVETYRALAAQFGIADRVHFADEFIAEKDVPNFFAAADAAVLPYGREFRSASGVLHLAARYGLPVAASGGPGPLADAMRDHTIGEWFEAMKVADLEAALRRIFARDRLAYRAGFERFNADLSWERNVDLLLEVAREVRLRRGLT